MKFRDRFLLAKTETVEGQDPNPDGSNALRSQEITWNPYEGSRQTIEDDRAGLGSFEEINPDKHIVAAFQSMFTGLSAVGVPDPFDQEPGVGPLLRACGMSADIDAIGETVTYTPVSSDTETIALWLIRKAIMHQSFGVRGNFTLNLSAGEVPRYDFDQFTGSYVRPAVPVAVTPANVLDRFPTARPFGFDNTPTFTIDGFAGCVQSFTYNLGNTVVWRDFANCIGSIIEDRQGSGTLVVEAPDVATKNFFEDLESHDGVTVVPINIVHGTVAGMIITVNLPRVQLRNISEQNTQGDLFYSMDFGVLPDPDEGDGDCEIIYS